MTFHGLKVFDFHAHFPTEKWANWMVSFQRRLAEKYGQKNVKILMEQSRRDREEMRKFWGFEPPESETQSKGVCQTENGCC